MVEVTKAVAFSQISALRRAEHARLCVVVKSPPSQQVAWLVPELTTS